MKLLLYFDVVISHSYWPCIQEDYQQYSYVLQQNLLTKCVFNPVLYEVNAHVVHMQNRPRGPESDLAKISNSLGSLGR